MTNAQQELFDEAVRIRVRGGGGHNTLSIGDAIELMKLEEMRRANNLALDKLDNDRRLAEGVEQLSNALRQRGPGM